jgi:uncharacterized iron-regulated protein
MIRNLAFLFFVCLVTIAQAQDKPAYRLFTKDGKAVDYDKMIRELAKGEVVFFGELHDNSIDHWLELQVTKDLYVLRKDLVLGFEMFEADDQVVLDEYLTGVIEERHLLAEAKVWDNYRNDYKPLIEFAKANQLRAIATNIPRRYANLVYRKGVESLSGLSAEAKQYIVPLPFEIDLELPGYKNMINSMGGHGTPQSAANIAKSQASKDATMAYFLMKTRSNNLFLHFNGAYHSQNFEGIIWYLKKAQPALKIVTIHTVEQDSIDKLAEEHKGTADFIICIPSDMNKTY